MRLEHADTRPESVIEAVTARLDPEQHPDDGEIEKHVTLKLRSRKPANAVREIIQLLAANRKIDDAEKFLGQVLSREQANPSVAVNGVAFPHARTDLVDEIVLGIGRSRAGIPFGKNGVRVRLIFVIGVPERLA